MPDKTGIQWTDATWNPVTGCSKVSPGCAHCYAETVAQRFPERFTDDGTFRPWTPENVAHNVLLHHDRLDQPSRWQRPRMVFVNSMSDLFHEAVPDEFIGEVFNVMALSRRHTFQVLTKRPERMRDVVRRWYSPEGLSGFGNPSRDLGTIHRPLPNVWLGVSIENRRYVDRADVLRETPAAVRFVSAEPLLGPLVRAQLRGCSKSRVGDGQRCIRPADHPGDCSTSWGSTTADFGEWPDDLDLSAIDWLIVGGESGPGARAMQIEWVRDLRAACASKGTAFFLKQLGNALAIDIPGARGKGGEPLEWPEDLRIREMPQPRAGTGDRG